MKQTIVNTRPKNIQQQTSLQFKEAGFDVIEFPCIEIVGNDDKEVLLLLKSIQVDDVVIFTSQFAVRFAYQLFPELKFNSINTVITVGKKSSETLEQYSNVDIWVPEKQNSEGVIDLLKALKSLKKIVLITAAQGRAEIQKFTTQHQIALQQINVYKRVLPKIETKAFRNLEESSDFLTLATSVTTITNLKELVPESLWCKFKYNQLICASERIREQAERFGFQNARNIGSAHIETIIKGLKKGEHLDSPF